MFTSYERDPESGNDYAQARIYINRLARFNSPDPISGSPAFPQTFNRYTYAVNDPVNLVDASSQYFLCTGWEVFIVTVGPEGEIISREDTGIFLVDECFDFGGGGGSGGGDSGGGGDGGGEPGNAPQVNIRALRDCSMALFGLNLLDFQPSAPGQNGVARLEGAQDNNYYNFGTFRIVNFRIVNDVSKSKGTLTFWAQQPRPNVEESTVNGYTFSNLDPTKGPHNPYTNYTASDTKLDFTFVQVWELGNSLAYITGSVPEAFEKDPEHNPDLEPGKQLTDCVKNGGPPGQQY